MRKHNILIEGCSDQFVDKLCDAVRVIIDDPTMEIPDSVKRESTEGLPSETHDEIKTHKSRWQSEGGL